MGVSAADEDGVPFGESALGEGTTAPEPPAPAPPAPMLADAADMDAMDLPQVEGLDGGYSAAEDDFATPRPRQTPFSDASACIESPSKPKTMSRMVGKAKTLVKALVRKRKVIRL